MSNARPSLSRALNHAPSSFRFPHLSTLISSFTPPSTAIPLDMDSQEHSFDLTSSPPTVPHKSTLDTSLTVDDARYQELMAAAAAEQVSSFRSCPSMIPTQSHHRYAESLLGCECLPMRSQFLPQRLRISSPLQMNVILHAHGILEPCNEVAPY